MFVVCLFQRDRRSRRQKTIVCSTKVAASAAFFRAQPPRFPRGGWVFLGAQAGGATRKWRFRNAPAQSSVGAKANSPRREPWENCHVHQAPARGERPMPLTLRFCICCGADPLVRAGPRGSARTRLRQWNQHPSRCKKADGGIGRGPGGPPHGQSKWRGAKDRGSAIFRPLRGLFRSRLVPTACAVGYWLSP